MMFEFFKKFINNAKSHKQEQHESHAAPGTTINYNPDLIGNLKSDHQTLLSIYRQIKTAFDSNNHSLVTKKLKVFKKTLTDHLLKENVNLYVYLGRSFANDEVNNKLVRGFRTEMNQITKVVVAFLSKYETIGVDKELTASFGKDLKAIGEALISRIKREEKTLYPLYIPPG